MKGLVEKTNSSGREMGMRAVGELANETNGKKKRRDFGGE